MRRTAVLAVALVLALAGCGGDADESDTSAAAGGGGTNTTMGMAGHGATDHMGNPVAVCSPSGNAVTIVANATKFDKECLAAPASQAFTITLDNKEGVPHNIAILESHTATDVLFRAEIFSGPGSKTFNVGALRPGTYAFHCEVHPNLMSGAFIVR